MQGEIFVNCLQWKRPDLELKSQSKQVVAELLQTIEQKGDSRIDELSQQFDGFAPSFIHLKPFADYPLSDELAESIKSAAQRIETFCHFQKQQLEDKYFEDETGRYGFCYKPINRIGAYIPGGRYPLISTALMTLIPARIAGSEQRIACSPSNHPAILAAASLAGATEFLHLGGAQAIAALAYGYQSCTPVQMIVGPGNQYVNAAKQLLQNKVAIDVAAGPSELLILAGKNINNEWIIADMAAQAEHDPQAVSILVSECEQTLSKVKSAIQSNQEIAKLQATGQIVLLKADDIEQMIKFSDSYAPEHLLLADERIDSQQLTHYGSLFIGENSAVAFGDYCSGPNHTLPTMGTANRSSGLSVLSFMKQQSIQQVSDRGRIELAKIGERLAEAEQLVWHKRSMQVRS
ncbi:MAG: histidinol dehydrogenase [Kangiellaceae bacterium]|nr:histidinol dehydrogenase [Kangiellaceae bacterium]